MALKTFSPRFPPSPGTERKPKLKLLKAEFGDGYTQTTRDGYNHMRRTLSLAWEKLPLDDERYIVRFLEEHGGDLAFYYKPSDESLPVKWTCEEWNSTVGEKGFRKVTAVFEQSFTLEN